MSPIPHPRAWTSIATRSRLTSRWDRLPTAYLDPAHVESLVALGDLERKIMTGGATEILRVRAGRG